MSTSHYHTPPTQTKEFELVTSGKHAPQGFPVRQHRSEKNVAPVTDAPDSSLRAFHEEFKSLVLAGEPVAEEDLVDGAYLSLFEPHEIEWNDFAREAHPARVMVPAAAAFAPAIAIKAAPQQAVRPLTGPRLGAPVAIESWVVKVIMVLVGLNLLFAGLIVAGVRLSDLLK